MDPLLRPLVEALGADAEPAGRALLDRYAEPHRRYHDLRHLAEVLQALRTLSGGAPPLPVLLAAYWHDAVYDPRAGDNEQRSADLAAGALTGPAPDAVDEVVRLVLLTAGHEPAPDDDAGALLCDADLAILGAPATRYAEYAADVRDEYAHVPDEAFRRGRTAVLRDLAGRPRLFRTAEGARRWEEPARRNLQAEVDALAAPRP